MRESAEACNTCAWTLVNPQIGRGSCDPLSELQARMSDAGRMAAEPSFWLFVVMLSGALQVCMAVSIRVLIFLLPYIHMLLYCTRVMRNALRLARLPRGAAHAV